MSGGGPVERYDLVGTTGTPVDRNNIRAVASGSDDDKSCIVAASNVTEGSNFSIVARFYKLTTVANNGLRAAIQCLCGSQTNCTTWDSLLVMVHEAASRAGTIELVYVNGAGSRTTIASTSLGNLTASESGVQYQVTVTRTGNNVAASVAGPFGTANVSGAIPAGLLTTGHNFFGFYIVRPGTDAGFALGEYTASWPDAGAAITDTITRLQLEVVP